ncbi:MAG: hypothetical protein M3X11_09240 [Acidobacteriota bacterium]|nr:hypothetical protein [Acidobacteriota bacterium]
MTPKVPRSHTRYQLAPISSLDDLLVLPIPKPEPLKRTLWMDFLSDLSFLLPAFGSVLGLILLSGHSAFPVPFLGAGMVTLCPIILGLRIHTAFQARRERRRVNALINWHRQYRVDYIERQRQITDDMPDVFYCPVPPIKR